MSDYVGVVTNAGQAKIAAAIGGTALNLTTIRVGDGNGAPITPNPAMTNLVRRVGNAYPIVSSGRDPVNANHWRVTTVIPVEDGPFDIREIGVWDAAGDMVAVAKHVLVEKRSPAQGAAVELLTDIVFPVSETAQVTVQVTPAAQVSIFQMLRAGFMVVESATVTAPPANPALGRTHVVPAGATGAWAGIAGYLVQWNGTVWVAVDVPVGFHVVDQSKGIDSGARWLERTAAGWVPGISRLIQKQPGNLAAGVGGTANALTATLDPAPASYAEVRSVVLIPAANNTAGAATLKLGALAALPIRYRGSSDLPAGILLAAVPTLFFCDSVSFHVVGPAASAAPRGYVVFGAPGTTNWTAPPVATMIRARSWAAGGGGGGAGTGSAGNPCAGAGGASGEYREGVFALTPSQVLPMTVGAGGAGGAAGGGNGGNGGWTSVGTLMSAASGSFGLGATSSLAGGAGLPSTGSGGQFYLSGNAGGGATRFSGDYAAGGLGGAAPLSGYGGLVSGSYTTAGNGYAGLTPGGGGGGGVGGGAGGRGGQGLIVIEYWG